MKQKNLVEFDTQLHVVQDLLLFLTGVLNIYDS